MKKNLVLLGMMGVGKTTIGKIVAKKQGLEFVDTDINIEKKCSMKISEIFIKQFSSIFVSVSINFKPSILDTILPKVLLPTPIIPNNTRFFLTLT